MPVHQLILVPQSREIVDEQRKRLLSRLHSEGFLGEAFQLDGRTHYFTGTAFLSQLIFLGCSPHIETEPPSEEGEIEPAARRGAFCHIHVTPVLSSPEFRTNPQARVRCPACRQSVPAMELLEAQTDLITCNKCGNKASIEAWLWRQNAGLGNLFIEVWSIHPGEAAPTEGFLQVIESAADTPWSFFYTRS